MESSRSLLGSSFLTFTLAMLTLANVEEQAQEWILNFKMGIIANGRNTSQRIFGHGIYVFNALEMQMHLLFLSTIQLSKLLILNTLGQNHW